MNSKGSRTKPNATLRAVAVLLLIVCLVNCAAEQRINSRGSKASNLIQKVNGWRSQRGGSCLSYGHSCWGAHGKRSGRAPSSAPDWYITRILRRMAANSDMNRAQNVEDQSEKDIYRVEDNATSNKIIRENEEVPVIFNARAAEAKPMLDDDTLSRMKFWQIMRAASEEN